MENSTNASDLLPQVEPELLVATCHPNSRVVSRNEPWRRIFGNRDDLWGHLPDRERDAATGAFRRAAHGSLVTNHICTVPRPGRDEPVPVLLNFVPVPSTDEGPRAAPDAISAVNITGEVLAEPATWTAHQTQRHRMEALGRMTMGIVHDFNNLLSALLGHAELIKSEMEERKVQSSFRQSIDTIEQVAVDGATLIEKIQRFIRQENETHFEPVDLPQIIDGCIALTRPYWYNEPRRQGIDITVKKDLKKVPSILGSPTELREIFVNLILNAVQAMPEGGELQFTTRYRPESGIEVRVADTGVGMEPEVKSRIFEPLFSTKGSDGNGMGLAVSYGIIQEHEGDVTVNSVPDRGTSFLLRFPPATRTKPLPVRKESPAEDQAVRVLVVDDEQLVRTVLTKLLGTRGHQVEQARSGAEALALVEQSSYDIIFTDQGMPAMNGRQLARALRRRWPDLPVVLLTGDTDLSGTENIDLVLGKPFKLERLQETIRQLVSSV